MTERRSQWEERYGSSKFTYGSWSTTDFSSKLTFVANANMSSLIANGEQGQVVGVRSLFLNVNAYHASSRGDGIIHLAIVKNDVVPPAGQSITPASLRREGYTVYRYRQMHLVPQTAVPLSTRVKAVSMSERESLYLMVGLSINDGASSANPVHVVFGGTLAIARADYGG